MDFRKREVEPQKHSVSLSTDQEGNHENSEVDIYSWSDDLLKGKTHSV